MVQKDDDVAGMFAGFEGFDIDTGQAVIHGVSGGAGPAILLLHGYPQTHAMWHRVAPLLARHYRVVCADLRGYGSSSKPQTDANHTPYSKRAMGADMLAVMRTLGHDRFGLVGHDRGGRVAHRLAADHGEAVTRLAVLDIAPTREMYRETSDAFARTYWHWFFLIQPAPFPERMIGADPHAYLRHKLGAGSAGLEPFSDAAMDAYQACFTPEAIHAMCEDYRAAAQIDIVHDDADTDKLPMPVLALWGQNGAIEAHFDCLSLWRERALDVSGCALPGGHYLAEECPRIVAENLLSFFAKAA